MCNYKVVCGKYTHQLLLIESRIQSAGSIALLFSVRDNQVERRRKALGITLKSNHAKRICHEICKIEKHLDILEHNMQNSTSFQNFKKPNTHFCIRNPLKLYGWCFHFFVKIRNWVFKFNSLNIRNQLSFFSRNS